MSLLINEMLLYLFAEFELHPSNNFREYQSWIDEYPFLNMIGSKLATKEMQGRKAFSNLPYSAANSCGSPLPFKTKLYTDW